MRATRGLMAVMLAAAVLAGCAKQQPAEQEPETNIVDEAPRPLPREREAPPPEPAPLRVPDLSANIADALPPDEPPSPDEQMLEDADASGLTARSAPPGVDTAESADPVGDLIANDGIGVGH